MARTKEKEIEMWRGRPRFAFRDTPRGIYSYDRKTGRQTYTWLGDRKKKHR